MIRPASATQPASASGAPLIRLERVGRAIGPKSQQTAILTDITFTVPTGSLFAINGPSGSGKSTLLNLLTGIDRPTSGTVIFDGEPLRAKREDALARWRGRHVGIVFQFFQLIPTLTALENVTLALELGGVTPKRQWRARALECLRLALVEDIARRLPSQISGGQQQRVAIARALANDPPVVIADEPTGNLDSQTAERVFDTLAELTERGKTVIYVTHDARLAGRATAGVTLLDGRVVATWGAGVAAGEARV